MSVTSPWAVSSSEGGALTCSAALRRALSERVLPLLSGRGVGAVGEDGEFGARVLEDERQLVAVEIGVDGDQDRASRVTGHEQGEEEPVVADHEGDFVLLTHLEVGQDLGQSAGRFEGGAIRERVPRGEMVDEHRRGGLGAVGPQNCRQRAHKLSPSSRVQRASCREAVDLAKDREEVGVDAHGQAPLCLGDGGAILHIGPSPRKTNMVEATP